MDDLVGLSWTLSTSEDSKQKPAPVSQSSYSYMLRPTPTLSGRTTPLTAPSNKPPANGIARSNASTPANDSFADLVAFNAAYPSKNLSLLEQQRKLQEERAKQQRGYVESQSGRQEEELWEKLGSGNCSPNVVASPPAYTASEEFGSRKLSATINKPSASIDTGQRRPTTKPIRGSDLLPDLETVQGGISNGLETMMSSTEHGGVGALQEPSQHLTFPGRNSTSVDDDDPFGLGSIKPKSQPAESIVQMDANGDEDILGLLGRPVSEFSQTQAQRLPSADNGNGDGTLAPINSQVDRALAELVDMGFAPEKSRQALETTASGTDVQAAVGWLLNQAHQESRSSSREIEPRSRRQENRQAKRSPPPIRSSAAEDAQPAWMKNTAAGSTYRSQQSSRSPVNGEKDSSKIAAELGNNLFKTANSLWKTGTKKLNQAVADFNSDSDSSQPKWMREPALNKDGPRQMSQSPQKPAVNGQRPPAKPHRPLAQNGAEVTDEALMLESADIRPPPRKPARPKAETAKSATTPEVSISKPASPAAQAYPRDDPQPKFMQQPRSNLRQDPRRRISKQAIEEQTAEAYISPARRKKITPKPPAPEPDLIFDSSQKIFDTSRQKGTTKPSSQHPPQETRRTPKPPQPQVPKRIIPSVSAIALRSSHTSRQAGTAAFIRGDYAEATTHYSSALAPLPPAHPLSITILTNRALSHLKTGDPKACIADTNTTIDLIGPVRGVGETVDLGDEGTKDMNTYWGKAMMRQAEALEQLEKWAEAGVVWKTCVEAGVGGGTSIAGRNRCEQAVKGASSTQIRPAAAKKATPKPKPKPKSKASALDDLSATPSSTATDPASGEAVTRLRAANVAAERLDDEKFALSDKVSERVSRWRGGKEGNLRALLASLDTVLWEGSGWKKVGMGELILPGKVKVVYMKGIGRVHPDKLPITATTEQRMISAAVFATLNEAWDGFKRENGL
ncbi:MAG: hypothetical protein LQ343_002962 [Gyalolechia ehrenbergii]|nr:MAG: hypothetical protein LQ343_002962 [Gyalolechia ehrenbergii]